MKKITSIIALILIFGTANAQKIKQVPKDLVVYDLEGNSKTMGEIMQNNGVPIIIDFWATWCRPCLMAIKNTNEKYPTWKKEDGVKMVLVSIDKPEKIAAIKAMAEKNKWEYELYIDKDKKTQRALKISQIPNTLLVDNEGNVLLHEVGYADGDEEHLIKKIRKYNESNKVK